MKTLSFALALLLLASTASAQAGRLAGVGMAVAGAAMLLVDPTQPVQPTQPGVVSRDTLRGDVAEYLDSDAFARLTVDTAVDLYGSRVVGACASLAVCTAGFVIGAQSGGIVGAAGALVVAHRAGRTVYASTFKPFIPYKERSAGLKYGGAALVIGGALLAVLWPDAPEQMSSLSITREVGGVRASKSFGW